jgi:hypothetical protein
MKLTRRRAGHVMLDRKQYEAILEIKNKKNSICNQFYTELQN